jgi:Nif-specific regulatory protein
MSPRLDVIAGPLKGATFVLTDEVSLGQNTSNAVSIPHPSAEGRLCVIKKEADQFRLLSIESRGRMQVNGLPVSDHVLQDGDEIKVGESVFLVLLSETSAAQDSLPLKEQELPAGSTLILSLEEALALKGEEALDTLAAATPIARDWNNLLHICRTISSIRDLEDLERHLVALIAEIVPAERGAIFLKGENPGDFAAVTGWDMRAGVERPVAGSRQVIDRVLRDGVAVLSNDIALDTNAPSDADAGSQVRALLAVPLEVFSCVRGVIYVDTSDPAVRFDLGHLRLLAAVGGLAALALENARRLRWLEAENHRLQAEINVEHNMVGDSPRMREVYRFIEKVASMDSTTLIYGESGTGKELAARAIHRNSPRSAKPFVAINCAALPETLLESELFGYEKGAFTGATTQKKGRLEVADGGTVFLDEIAELPSALQPKLLRVLQERELERLGGTHSIPLNVRLIAATNKDLSDAVREGTFRTDLYYRLNVVSLTMPPLRERREDILPLADCFLSKYGPQGRRHIAGISPEARSCLRAYDWPGNVRELENAIERAVVLGTSELIAPEDLPEPVLEKAGSSHVTTYHDAVADAKRCLILKAIRQNGGNYTHAAKALGVHPTYLHRLIRNLNLKPDSAR